MVPGGRGLRRGSWARARSDTATQQEGVAEGEQEEDEEEQEDEEEGRVRRPAPSPASSERVGSWNTTTCPSEVSCRGGRGAMGGVVNTSPN